MERSIQEDYDDAGDAEGKKGVHRQPVISESFSEWSEMFVDNRVTDEE